MKVLFFADLHIHPHKRSQDRLQDCVDALDWVLGEASKRLSRGEFTTVVFLGDLFHDRQRIDVLTYQKTFEVFEKYQIKNHGFGAIPIYLLLGNHDMWHLEKWDVSSVNPLRSMEGVRVIDKPCTVDLGGFPISFLPYTDDPHEDIKIVEESYEKWVKENGEPRRKILGGHVAVDGALWNTMHQTFSEVTVEHDGEMKVVSPSMFSGWDRVFLGHYHAAQELSYNVEYIGSPLQLSFGEAFQEKQILIYDTVTGEKEYVKNTFSPQHFIIPEADLHKYDLKNNFIRVMVDDITAGDVVQLRKSLVEDHQVGSLEIKPVPQKHDDKVKDAATILLKEDEMLEGFIEEMLKEKHPLVEGLDKDKLLKIGKSICEASTEESK
jgi:DNA repair exonuclease SbcCD nuclease subunit